MFDNAAFADEAQWVTYTGGSPQMNAANVVGSNLGTYVEYHDGTGGSGHTAVIQLVFTDNLIVNGPGIDLFVYELGFVEQFEVAFGNDPTFHLIPPDQLTVVGHEVNAARLDLSDYGFVNNASIDRIRVRLTDYGSTPPPGNLGTRSADIAAAGAKYVVPLPGLVAHYTFDGTFENASGPIFNGVKQGGPSSFDFGVNGLAARFDGIDDWVRVDHGGELTFDLDDQSFSFSVYVNAEVPQPGSQPIVLQDRFGNDSPTTNLVVRGDGSLGNINCNSWYGSGTNLNFHSFANAPVHLRGWIHIVCTYDASLGLKMLYVDGTLVDMDLRPNLEFIPNSDGVLTIGAGWYPGGMTNFYRGLMDDLRIYNIALSPQEVAELYVAKCPGDLTGSTDPMSPAYGVPDGIVDASDFFYYLDLFVQGCP